MEKMNILAFESSCDETSASVVRFDGKSSHGVILSNIIASSVQLHALYGGVVPEIAGRAHIEAISAITYEALDKAGVGLDDIECIGVTSEPGLVGSLLVALNFAKSLAYSRNIPLVPVHHIKGHIAANYLVDDPPKPPFTALVMSGGHTSVIKVETYTDMKTIAYTRDDAIGEAFDKSARVLGLPYPGGAEMDRLAYEGNCRAYKLPLAIMRDGSYDFSFSGLKTAVVNLVHNARQKGEELNIADVAASFTETVCTSVEMKLEQIYETEGMTSLVLAGGVAANSHLRTRISDFCKKHDVRLYMPPLSLCGDNAAMIAGAAYYEYMANKRGEPSLNARATSPF